MTGNDPSDSPELPIDSRAFRDDQWEWGRRRKCVQDNAEAQRAPRLAETPRFCGGVTTRRSRLKQCAPRS
jgi:hypothetical protein